MSYDIIKKIEIKKNDNNNKWFAIINSADSNVFPRYYYNWNTKEFEIKARVGYITKLNKRTYSCCYDKTKAKKFYGLAAEFNKNNETLNQLNNWYAEAV